ncbi:4-hydroxy-tetrahydrodipicolinate synthase [Paenibacillus sp. MBLB4367]|uniref:4-hydroxy-tetrahydrodipicolinate synthase n=1 Tax=Paenibacillus sp. MBLB4367 TaxID=3384767 RepID=UPI00390810A1
MLTAEQLRGIYVPIVTPFHADGKIDWTSFHNLAEQVTASGINGLVVNGTTGECPTVSGDEAAALIRAAKAAVSPKGIPVIAGTGSNDTADAVKKTEQAASQGADAALAVVPYYNKPSQEGIVEHFRRIAAVGLPVIAYDIPHRTGVGLTLESARTIMEMDGVIGLKDSSGSLQMVSELSLVSPKPVLCGDDACFFASLCCGAQGGMLASANVRTERFVRVYELFRANRIQEAKLAFEALLPLIRLLFQEPNPAPLKWLLSQQGIIESETLRLPMTPISRSLAAELAVIPKS